MRRSGRRSALAAFPTRAARSRRLRSLLTGSSSEARLRLTWAGAAAGAPAVAGALPEGLRGQPAQAVPVVAAGREAREPGARPAPTLPLCFRDAQAVQVQPAAWRVAEAVQVWPAPRGAPAVLVRLAGPAAAAAPAAESPPVARAQASAPPRRSHTPSTAGKWFSMGCVAACPVSFSGTTLKPAPTRPRARALIDRFQSAPAGGRSRRPALATPARRPRRTRPPGRSRTRERQREPAGERNRGAPLARAAIPAARRGAVRASARARAPSATPRT